MAAFFRQKALRCLNLGKHSPVNYGQRSLPCCMGSLQDSKRNYHAGLSQKRTSQPTRFGIASQWGLTSQHGNIGSSLALFNVSGARSLSWWPFSSSDAVTSATETAETISADIAQTMTVGGDVAKDISLPIYNAVMESKNSGVIDATINATAIDTMEAATTAGIGTVEAVVSSTEALAGTAEAAEDVVITSRMVLDGYIPDAPPVPIPEITMDMINALGEPTLASLGFCNYTPPGLYQKVLELLHVSADFPWWAAIACSTICIRIMLFPLVIKAQKQTANIANCGPTMTVLQANFSQARTAGNPMDAAKAHHELNDFMKRNDVNPLKAMIVPMCQVPIFISVFMGLRKMANLPVESMSYGGIWWFTDLTVADPYYLLPLLTAGTLLVTIELGTDSMRSGQLSHSMKWFMRAMPCIMFPFMMNFPTAMLCYWFSSNSFSFAQMMFLKIPTVRKAVGIPLLVKHPKDIQTKKKGFVEGFKETWDNSKTMAKVKHRQQDEQQRFKSAGTGPIVKTYKYNPKLTAKPQAKQKS